MKNLLLRIILVELTFLTVMVVLSMGWAANVPPASSRGITSGAQNSLTTPTTLLNANEPGLTTSPCADTLAQRAVCVAANNRALEIMSADNLKAVVVIQDVRTGAVVAFAASQPSEVDVTTAVRPLSLSKLLLAASWWDNRQPNADFDSIKGTPDAENAAYRSRVSVHEMLVGGSDSAGTQMAAALRKSVGTKVVLEDFKRYGFGKPPGSPRDDMFWSELARTWKTRLIPASGYVSLGAQTKDAQWAQTLSIGESNITVTALHISRFLQAIGNNGLMLRPVAREVQSIPTVTKPPVPSRELKNPMRVMKEDTALRLQSAMRDTVQRGTAKSIAKALETSGWQMGGKTGSGPALLPQGSQIDGWFAGLIFDPQGKARFTVATFVRSGGYGGGSAAKISAELARFIIGTGSYKSISYLRELPTTNCIRCSRARGSGLKH